MKISATRRMFFGWMGSSAIAAKTAADQVIADAAGFGQGGLVGLGNSAMHYAYGEPADANMDASPSTVGKRQYTHAERLVEAGKYITQHGIPPYLEERYRDEVRVVYALDPDIACKRSWSMSVKIATQRERNYHRRVQHSIDLGKQQMAKNALSKLLGFTWPW